MGFSRSLPRRPSKSLGTSAPHLSPTPLPRPLLAGASANSASYLASLDATYADTSSPFAASFGVASSTTSGVSAVTQPPSSVNLALALGVGLGVGIPVLALLIASVVLLVKKRSAGAGKVAVSAVADLYHYQATSCISSIPFGIS